MFFLCQCSLLLEEGELKLHDADFVLLCHYVQRVLSGVERTLLGLLGVLCRHRANQTRATDNRNGLGATIAACTSRDGAQMADAHNTIVINWQIVHNVMVFTHRINYIKGHVIETWSLQLYPGS